MGIRKLIQRHMANLFSHKNFEKVISESFQAGTDHPIIGNSVSGIKTKNGGPIFVFGEYTIEHVWHEEDPFPFKRIEPEGTTHG